MNLKVPMDWISEMSTMWGESSTNLFGVQRDSSTVLSHTREQ